jgi:hypothetical protein
VGIKNSAIRAKLTVVLAAGLQAAGINNWVGIRKLLKRKTLCGSIYSATQQWRIAHL